MPRLGSVVEDEEASPLASEQDEEPQDSEDITNSSPSKPRTPAHCTPVKPPASEMHPSKAHQTMAPPSSGLRHGFVDINKDQKPRESGGTQGTPSKTPVADSSFRFRVARPSASGSGDIGLGTEAQKMMYGLREEAARIKADLAAKREKERLESDPNAEARRFAKPAGKAGRFSDVHMAEFQKMDSIANHPSAYRCAPGRVTPAKTGLKRTQSKANLADEPESASRKSPASSRSKLASSSKPVEKRPVEQNEASFKRSRRNVEDDASTARPVTRDDSTIPRPKASGIPRSQTTPGLMTPTKASAARTNIPTTPTTTLMKSPSKTDIRGLARSTSKPNLSGLAKSASKADLRGVTKSSSQAQLGGLARSPSKPDLYNLTKTPSKTELFRSATSANSKTVQGSATSSATPATTSNLGPSQSVPSLVQTPGRFDRVKSILKKPFTATKPRSHIPQLPGVGPKTPSKAEKQQPPAPLTTPRNVEKRVEFTPQTKQAAMTQNSPSPVKPILRRPQSASKLPKAHFQSLGAMSSAKKTPGDVSYPDLSSYHAEAVADTEEAEGAEEVEELDVVKTPELPKAVPGTFTFRSDHTISFGTKSSHGFGGAAGQASVRQVRASIAPGFSMPGSFPGDRDVSPDKENADPGLMKGIPHGMSNKKRSRAIWEDEEVKTGISHGISNKKRHRASSDAEEEQDEELQRGTKKLRKYPPGQTTPKTIKSSPIKKVTGMSGTPNSRRKGGGITMSRLNMLAQPKMRK